MAKRRKIEAPSAEQLNQIEEEFRRETSLKPNPSMAPIAQVSADTARRQSILDKEARVREATTGADAEMYRAATAEGRYIHALNAAHIKPDAIVRDRMVIDAAEMEELKASIRENGVRLPVEVFKLKETQYTYGLLSGFRRLRAVKELYDETGDDTFKTIPCLIRDPDKMGGSFAAMVEENEIRSALSHFERGRIAVLAAQRGAFADTEAAVADLFKSASKAKRSKIRSFSLIFEELGDLLNHAEGMTEKNGLALAAALRAGAAEALREALAEAHAASADAEWAALAPVVARTGKPADPAKGGRPKAAKREVLTKLRLPGDVTLQAESDARGFAIRLEGKGADRAMLDRALAQVEAALRGKGD